MFSDDSSGKTCRRKPSKIHALFLLIVTVRYFFFFVCFFSKKRLYDPVYSVI